MNTAKANYLTVSWQYERKPPSPQSTPGEHTCLHHIKLCSIPWLLNFSDSAVWMVTPCLQGSIVAVHIHRIKTKLKIIIKGELGTKPTSTCIHITAYVYLSRYLTSIGVVVHNVVDVLCSRSSVTLFIFFSSNKCLSVLLCLFRVHSL